VVKPGDFVQMNCGMIVSVLLPTTYGEPIRGVWLINGQLRNYTIGYSPAFMQAVGVDDRGIDRLNTSERGELFRW